MLMGNGKATPDRVWFSSSAVNVAPNTQYYFEAWVMNRTEGREGRVPAASK